MGLASLLWNQRKGGRACYGASRTDHSTGSPFWCIFIATPLQVGRCAVVGPWWAGYDGADIMTFRRSRCLLLHGCSLKKKTTGINQRSLIPLIYFSNVCLLVLWRPLCQAVLAPLWEWDGWSAQPPSQLAPWSPCPSHGQRVNQVHVVGSPLFSSVLPPFSDSHPESLDDEVYLKPQQVNHSQ